MAVGERDGMSFLVTNDFNAKKEMSFTTILDSNMLMYFWFEQVDFSYRIAEETEIIDMTGNNGKLSRPYTDEDTRVTDADLEP